MVETMQFSGGVLALAAAIAAIFIVASRLAPAGSGLRLAGDQLLRHRIALIAAIGVLATLGSLYFSEIANMAPCRLCWFQRVLMYPIAVVGLVGLVRRDAGARWYAGALAAIGASVSTYHTIIEWRPELDTGSCELFGPACSVVYFRTFGFMSLATMALCGFVAVLALAVFADPMPNEGADQIEKPV